jgi:hypothetical protein
MSADAARTSARPDRVFACALVTILLVLILPL